MELKNVIFDLGGVLLGIDINKCVASFEKIGIRNINQHFSNTYQDEAFYKIETGHMSNEQFHKRICELGNNNISYDEFTICWNTILLDYFAERINYIEKEIKPFYKTYLLSNTNLIHKIKYEKDFAVKFKYNDLSSFFDKAYYSHEIGLRKPNSEIFEFVINDAEINAKESIFIDDNLENVLMAKKLGFDIVHLKDNNQWKYFEKLINSKK